MTKNQHKNNIVKSIEAELDLIYTQHAQNIIPTVVEELNRSRDYYLNQSFVQPQFQDDLPF